MRLHVVSDLHVDCASFKLPEVEADVLVIAGDFRTSKRGPKGDRLMRKILKWSPRYKRTYFVLGNHEYYDCLIGEAADEIKRTLSVDPTVKVLHCEKDEFYDVSFVGCTLWSDLRPMNVVDQTRLRLEMPDYRNIKIRQDDEVRRLAPEDTQRLHESQVGWLRWTLGAIPDEKKVVVVTHHSPTLRTIRPEYERDVWNAAFQSDLDQLILDYPVELWVHGHLHDASEHVIGTTRVLCNPRGYPGETGENGFRPDLVVEV